MHGTRQGCPPVAIAPLRIAARFVAGGSNPGASASGSRFRTHGPDSKRRPGQQGSGYQRPGLHRSAAVAVSSKPMRKGSKHTGSPLTPRPPFPAVARAPGRTDKLPGAEAASPKCDRVGKASPHTLAASPRPHEFPRGCPEPCGGNTAHPNLILARTKGPERCLSWNLRSRTSARRQGTRSPFIRLLLLH